MVSLTSNAVEAANRAEATSLLIRCGYRVYRPEADIEGEDLVIRAPDGDLRGVQLKGRVSVDRRRYGERNLWMLFPDRPFYVGMRRHWYLCPHDKLYNWVSARHSHTPKWKEMWSYPNISRALATLLQEHMLEVPSPLAGVDLTRMPRCE